MLSLFRRRTPRHLSQVVRPSLHVMMTIAYAIGPTGRAAVWSGGRRIEFPCERAALAYVRGVNRIARKVGRVAMLDHGRLTVRSAAAGL